MEPFIGPIFSLFGLIPCWALRSTGHNWTLLNKDQLEDIADLNHGNCGNLCLNRFNVLIKYFGNIIRMNTPEEQGKKVQATYSCWKLLEW